MKLIIEGSIQKPDTVLVENKPCEKLRGQYGLLQDVYIVFLFQISKVGNTHTVR